jgi:hypothetical protein
MEIKTYYLQNIFIPRDFNSVDRAFDTLSEKFEVMNWLFMVDEATKLWF